MISSIVRGLSRRFNAELLKVTMEGCPRFSVYWGDGTDLTWGNGTAVEWSG